MKLSLPPASDVLAGAPFSAQRKMIETTTDKLAVSRECLNSLGALPEKLRLAPRGARRHSAEVAISLGNWLLWIAPKLDCPIPPGYHQPTGTPDTVKELGRRFREIGVELWNQDDSPLPAPLDDNRIYQAVAAYLDGAKLRAEAGKERAR